MYAYIYVPIHTSTYKERERERERIVLYEWQNEEGLLFEIMKNYWVISNSFSNIYIYIYIYRQTT